MRWFFLLLLVLNLFYFVWHQQRAPLRITEVPAVGPYRQSDERLSLLSEVVTPDTPRRPSKQPVSSSRCVYVGEFVGREVAEALLQQLRALDIDGEVVSRQLPAGEDYWVYLPPLASREAAIRQLRELQARNIDSYVVTMGELENGISLGIYAQQGAALLLQERVTSLGYAAAVRVLLRSHERFSVYIKAGAREALDAAFLAGSLDAQLARSEGPCEGVANDSLVE